MPRRLFTLVLGVLLLLGLMAPASSADGYDFQLATPKVMTLNMYIGADITRVLDPENPATPAEILETIKETNIVERAQAMAAAIDHRNPDLIGLQEVSLITLFTFGAEGNQVVIEQADYLDILLKSLAARGEKYEVVSQVKNADITLPISEGVFGNVTDRDAILARVGTTETTNPRADNYAVNFQVPSGGAVIEFTRGWTAVDAKVRGAKVTFVNTHFEVAPDPETGAGFCGTLEKPFPCQIPQAQELMKILAGAEYPVILVGDFNAEPGTAAYNIIAAAGFADAWDLQLFDFHQNEDTCCQAEDLRNPESLLDERIDLIFIRHDGWVISAVTVIFDRPGERTDSDPPLWPSDHGSVVGRLLFVTR